MSWIFTTTNKEFEEAVEKATSEMLPNAQEDLAMNLEITDKIRSKSVPAKEAMRTIKKRLSHRNPNVQLLTLKLADTCVKNGGSHFLCEVASREFMDSLVGLVNGQNVNDQVRQKCLQLIQMWNSAFKGRDELRYVADTYQSLKGQGITFPAVNSADHHGYSSSVMLDTTAAPDWTDSDVCERCRELFTLTKRKHHCRSCGKTYCNACSSRTMPLPRLGITDEVRVCENCYLKQNGGNSGDQPQTPVRESSKSSDRQQIDAARREEDELQRAIALSILESEGKGSSMSQAASQQSRAQQKSAVKPRDDSEDDPELAAAIAASLREVGVSSSPSKQHSQATSGKAAASIYPSEVNQFERYQQPPPERNAVQQYAPNGSQTAQMGSSSQTTPQPQQPAPGKNELSASELKNIDLFTQLMNRMDSTLDIQQKCQQASDPVMRTMYDSMIQMHPRLVKQIEECVERHKQLMQLHEKITVGVGVFDRVNEEAKKSREVAQQTQLQQQSYYGQPPAQPQMPFQPQYQYQSPQVGQQQQPYQTYAPQYSAQQPPNQPQGYQSPYSNSDSGAVPQPHQYTGNYTAPVPNAQQPPVGGHVPNQQQSQQQQPVKKPAENLIDF